VKKERTRSQIARGARNKGNKAQREIAKLLGIWFFLDDDIFHSTPSSGGLRWKSKVGGTRGDIVTPDNIDWPFSIEIKNQEKSNWDLYSILFNQGPIINDWWTQAEKDANEVNSQSTKYVLPWLIFKRNQVPFLMIMGETAFNNELLGIGRLNLPNNSFYITNMGLYIMPLSAFLLSNKRHNIEDCLIQNSPIIKRHIINPSKGLSE